MCIAVVPFENGAEPTATPNAIFFCRDSACFRIKFRIDFLIDFGAILEAQINWTQGGCGMRGAWLDSLSSKNSKDYFENESRHAPTLRVAADDGKRLGA